MQWIGVDAEMNVTVSEFCIVSPRGMNSTMENIIALRSNPSDPCTALVTTTPDSASLLQIHKISETDLVFIEMQSEGTSHCLNQILAVHGGSEPCSIILPQDQFQINLKGDIDVLITDIKSSEAELSCSVSQPQMSALNNTLPACSVQEYSSIIPYLWKNKGNKCSFEFPPQCNTSLGFRQATLHCQDLNQAHHVLIDYPNLLDIEDLSFRESRVINISVDVFKGMTELKKLRLHFNNLTSLPLGIFDNLPKLTIINFRENELTYLPNTLFHNLHKLDTLLLNFNRLTSLDPLIFSNLKQLTNIKLYNNHLEHLDTGIFDALSSMVNLDLSANKFDFIASDLFRGLHDLIILLLNDNFLTSLYKDTFQDLWSLTSLSLANNRLAYIEPELFNETTELVFLELSNNRLHRIPNINNLPQLHQLFLEGNSFQSANDSVLASLSRSAVLIVSQVEICECYTPTAVDCSATKPRSPYLTCDRLLSDRVLVVFMWIIGLSASAGNLFVLTWRKKHSAKNKVQSRLLHNLALSDLQMGLYMIIIGSADIYFGDNFPLQSESWRTGSLCRFAGALCITSSEASVIFVTLISIDRFICIKYPHTKYKFAKNSTTVTILLTWATAVALGVIPSMLAGKNDKFYDNSHVCIGIPLALLQSYNSTTYEKEVDFEKHFSFDKIVVETTFTGPETGMYFSTAVFLGVNCLCYIVILICYIILLQTVYKSSKRAGLNKEMKAQIRLTAKVAAIVATDFFCWSPIIILGILVQAGVVELPPSVFAWSVTVILPINSAINPYLYTISDIVYNRRKQIHPSDYGSRSKATEQTGVSKDQNGTSRSQAPKPASVSQTVNKQEALPRPGSVLVPVENADTNV